VNTEALETELDWAHYYNPSHQTWEQYQTNLFVAKIGWQLVSLKFLHGGGEGEDGAAANEHPSGCFGLGTLVRSNGSLVPIERIEIGNRVSASPSDRSDCSIIPADYRLVHLGVLKDAQEVRVSLLRPASCLDGLCVGDTVQLSMMELASKARARVLGIEPCPPIVEGVGRVVRGTIRSQSFDVRLLKLAGVDAPIEVTGGHPVFSEDRGDFIIASQLQTGERLRTHEGVALVESVTPKPGRWEVCNLVVDQAHQYYVGELCLLVHNSNNCGVNASGSNPNAVEGPGPSYNPDQTQPPGPGYQWRGKGGPGSGKGSWYNPSSGESLHPDLNHPAPVGPHYDYTAPNGDQYRLFPDNSIQPK
jgi:hypothetical protein